MSDLSQTSKVLANFEGMLEHLKELILGVGLDEAEVLISTDIFDRIASLYDRFTDRVIAEAAAQDPVGFATKTSSIEEAPQALENIQERIRARMIHDLQRNPTPLAEGGVSLVRRDPKETVH